MRGKLRDKRDVKRDRLNREIMGRRSSKRENRNLHLLQTYESDQNDYALEEESKLTISEEQQN
jgi:hypothetical protein